MRFHSPRQVLLQEGGEAGAFPFLGKPGAPYPMMMATRLPHPKFKLNNALFRCPKMSPEVISRQGIKVKEGMLASVIPDTGKVCFPSNRPHTLPILFPLPSARIKIERETQPWNQSKNWKACWGNACSVHTVFCFCVQMLWCVICLALFVWSTSIPIRGGLSITVGTQLLITKWFIEDKVGDLMIRIMLLEGDAKDEGNVNSPRRAT